MDARDKVHYERARAVARELGLDTIDVDSAKEIRPEAWRAWAQLEPSKRLIAFIAEGFVASTEAAEVADVKRRNMRGVRKGTGLSNELAKDVAIGRVRAGIYSQLLTGIAREANKV